MDYNQISEMIDRVRKLKNEELKGNQHKIDANKNGKVDAHDFKLLRKMKKEEIELEEAVTDDVTEARYYGYDSHGYSLRPGHDEGEPVRDRRYGSSYSGPSDSAKIYHKVPFAQRDAAKAEGMRWDSTAKKWYHTSSTKSNQSKFEKS